MSITILHPSHIHHHQLPCDPSSTMPVSTRSMTINATMERERMRREIREANVSDNVFFFLVMTNTLSGD
jgi:hypothetical protein